MTAFAVTVKTSRRLFYHIDFVLLTHIGRDSPYPGYEPTANEPSFGKVGAGGPRYEGAYHSD